MVREATIGEILKLATKQTGNPWASDTSGFPLLLNKQRLYGWWKVTIPSARTVTLSHPLEAVVLEATADEKGTGVWQIGIWQYHGNLSSSDLELVHAVRRSEPTLAKPDLISCLGPIRGAHWSNSNNAEASRAVLDELVRLLDRYTTNTYRR